MSNLWDVGYSVIKRKLVLGKICHDSGIKTAEKYGLVSAPS